MDNMVYFKLTRSIAEGIHRSLVDATENIPLPSYRFDLGTDRQLLRACDLLNNLDFENISSLHPLHTRLRFAVAISLVDALAEAPSDLCKARIADLQAVVDAAPEIASSEIIRGIIASVLRRRVDFYKNTVVKTIDHPEVQAADGTVVTEAYTESEVYTTIAGAPPTTKASVENVFEPLFMLRETFGDLYRTDESRRFTLLVKQLYVARRGFVKLGQENPITKQCTDFFSALITDAPNTRDTAALTDPLEQMFKTLMDFADPFEITPVVPQEGEDRAFWSDYTMVQLPDGNYSMVKRKVQLLQRKTLWSKFQPVFASFALALEAYQRFIGMLFGPDLVQRYREGVDRLPANNTLTDRIDGIYRNGFRALHDNLQAAWFSMAQFFVEHFSTSIQDEIELLRGEIDSQLRLD